MKTIDVTSETRARKDAHPLKRHDRVLRVEHGDGRRTHVKVRAIHHETSSAGNPVLHLTASIAEETGKAKVDASGKPMVNEIAHQMTFLGDDPGDGVSEFDVQAWLDDGRAVLARRAARAAAAFDLMDAQAGAATPPKPLPVYLPTAPPRAVPLALPAPQEPSA